jgi:hypothetical protein
MLTSTRPTQSNFSLLVNPRLTTTTMTDRPSSVEMYNARNVLNDAAEALENRTPESESDCVMPAHSFLSECQHFREQGWEKD